MLMTAEFWVAVAFFIFVGALAKPVFVKVNSFLQNYIDNIKTELDKIRQLRIEAKDQVTEYQKKHHQAIREAEQIVEQSKLEVERLQKISLEELSQDLKRQEQKAIERIEVAKDRAMAEVKEMAVDIAIATSTKLLQEVLVGDDSEKLVEEQMKALPLKLN